jgi:transcriptional regulator NrdR family protein
MYECPKCMGDTKVLETRMKNDLPTRKRVCKDCNYMFYTVEIPELEYLNSYVKD